MVIERDEDLHKIMDINKVFPKPPEVEEEMRRQKEEDLVRAEQEELARVKALAPVLVPPTMSQLMAAQIEGHSVDMPVSNPFLTDKLIDEELKQMMDMQVSEKRRGVNFKKYEKTPADISASHTLEALRHEHDLPGEVGLEERPRSRARVLEPPRPDPGLRPKDRGRMGNNDVSKKANLQKDWNCPWVSKDGSRLKQAIRYVDEPVAQASTSHQHYYSQPGSILAPEPQISKEQLEALIREHGQDSRPESRAQQQTSSSKHAYHEEQHEETFRQEMSSSHYGHEREEDSQAPPELEPINLGYEQFQQQSMGGFGQEAGYEPSADELIDVLKNLENLAAADPQLYRTIVDQIKGGAMGGFFQQSSSGNGQASQYEQQMYEQQQREAQIYEQQQQQQMQMQMEQQRMYEEQQRMMQQQEESSMQQQQSFSSSSSVQQQQKQQTSSSSSSMRQEQTSSMRQEQSSSMQMQQETKMTKKVHQVT